MLREKNCWTSHQHGRFGACLMAFKAPAPVRPLPPGLWPRPGCLSHVLTQIWNIMMVFFAEPPMFWSQWSLPSLVGFSSLAGQQTVPCTYITSESSNAMCPPTMKKHISDWSEAGEAGEACRIYTQTPTDNSESRLYWCKNAKGARLKRTLVTGVNFHKLQASTHYLNRYWVAAQERGHCCAWAFFSKATLACQGSKGTAKGTLLIHHGLLLRKKESITQFWFTNPSSTSGANIQSR